MLHKLKMLFIILISVGFLTNITKFPKSVSTPFIIFNNIGQGDAILIGSEKAGLFVIDGGPSFEMGFLSYFLEAIGSCKLSGVLLTHPHADHLVGLTRLMSLCDVGNVFFSDVPYPSEIFNGFKRSAFNGVYRPLHRGDTFSLGELDFYVLWPPKGYNSYIDTTNANDISTVLLLDYKNFEALLTGDINAKIQNRLNIEEYMHIIDGKIDIYKVPHHGSASSFDEGFLLWLQPKMVVVSVGENSYGHPSPLFMDFFSAQNIPVYRTDVHGNLIIYF